MIVYDCVIVCDCLCAFDLPVGFCLSRLLLAHIVLLLNASLTLVNFLCGFLRLSIPALCVTCSALCVSSYLQAARERLAADPRSLSKREARRILTVCTEKQEPGTVKQEPGTEEQEPGTEEQEPGTEEQEPATKKQDAAPELEVSSTPT